MIKRLALMVATTLLVWRAAGAVRAPEWVQGVAAAPLPKYSDKTRGVILLDETSVVATGNGELRRVRRVATRILGTAGRDLGVVAIAFGGDTKLKRLTGWSITSTGIYQVGERNAVETAAFDGELYADQKLKILHLPGAEPGSVVAYEVETIERPYALQDVWRFQSELPVRRARYTMTLPEGWQYESRWINTTAVEPQRGGSSLAWELNDIPAVEPEPGAPVVHAISGYMGISFAPPGGGGHRTWNDVARWYAGLAEPQRVVSSTIEAKTRALTAGSATTWENVTTLARFAQRDVRYVAIAIGIGSHQPHKADSILSTLYGDCKDKVTLLSSMLRTIGVESHYVLVNSERGVVDERFPSLFGFNHAIIAIKVPDGAPKTLPASAGGLLYFDPTHPYVPVGLLPAYLQGSRGLVVIGDRGEMVELPAHAPDSSRLHRTAKLKLSEDGSLEGEVHEVRTGEIAANFRSLLAGLTAHAQRELIDRMLASHLDQHSIRDLVIENADDPSKDLVVRYVMTAPRYARSAGGMLLVRPRVIGSKPESLLDLADRKHDYLTEGPSQQVDDVEIILPASLAADELPPKRNVRTAAITYNSESTFETRTLRYRRRYEVLQHLVRRENLGELNKAFGEILADERSSAVLK